MISELGFLSPDAEESERQILKAYCDVFDVCTELVNLFLRMLKEAVIDTASEKSLAMNALAAKSLELFQSSQILLQKGCIPATKVVCRAQIETVYKLCAIQLATNGIQLYVRQERSTRLQKLKSIQQYKQKHKGSRIAPGIEAEIESLSKDKTKKTEPHEWASLAQMDDYHNLYYQGMSDDTHANMESLNYYFDENSDHLVSFGPSNKGLFLVATACQRTLINAIEKYALFQNACIADELSFLSRETDALEGKYGNG